MDRHHQAVSKAAASLDRAGQQAEGHSPPSLPRDLIHDLNNFLGIILGNSELMIDQPNLDARSARRVEHIYQAAIKARDAIVKVQNTCPNGN